MNEIPIRVSRAGRRRGLVLIWGAQLLSLAFLFFLTYVVRPDARPTDNDHTLAWTLGAVGFTTFLASFLVKRKLLAQAAAKGRADLGTTAYVLAFAMCELTAVLGFLAYVLTGLSYALHSFIIAAVGLSLHFPPRDALEGIEAHDASANLNKTTL